MTASTRPAKLRIDYPRPPLVSDHAQLFVEADYADGEPYAQPGDKEDDE